MIATEWAQLPSMCIAGARRCSLQPRLADALLNLLCGYGYDRPGCKALHEAAAMMAAGRLDRTEDWDAYVHWIKDFFQRPEGEAVVSLLRALTAKACLDAPKPTTHPWHVLEVDIQCKIQAMGSVVPHGAPAALLSLLPVRVAVFTEVADHVTRCDTGPPDAPCIGGLLLRSGHAHCLLGNDALLLQPVLATEQASSATPTCTTLVGPSGSTPPLLPSYPFFFCSSRGVLWVSFPPVFELMHTCVYIKVHQRVYL